MFFQRGTLHLVQPAPLCKQVVAHYTFLERQTFKEMAVAFLPKRPSFDGNARRALRRKEMTSWPR
jgi:hypothetical protein